MKNVSGRQIMAH